MSKQIVSVSGQVMREKAVYKVEKAGTFWTVRSPIGLLLLVNPSIWSSRRLLYRHCPPPRVVASTTGILFLGNSPVYEHIYGNSSRVCSDSRICQSFALKKLASSAWASLWPSFDASLARVLISMVIEARHFRPLTAHPRRSQ